MSNPTLEERKQFWSKHITAWERSHQSQAAYCEAHQLKKKSFWYWKRKLSQKTAATPDSTHFVTLPVIQANQTIPTSLTIVLPNGISIKHIHADNMLLLKDLTDLLQ